MLRRRSPTPRTASWGAAPINGRSQTRLLWSRGGDRGEAGLDAQGASHPLPAVDTLSAPILAKGARDSGTRWFSRL